MRNRPSTDIGPARRPARGPRPAARFAAIACVALACHGPVRAALVPPAPDYSQADAWAAWPGQPSGADVVPPGAIAARPAAATGVDVFFIHPTTYLSGAAPNARYDEPGSTATAIERGVLRFQASAFNACCRVFAPRYRQAALAAFLGDDAGQDRDAAAFELAYGDVLRAFDDYLARSNRGRPFIIAGHSQGSLHALRLLQERIAGRPLQQRLVAAYVVGYDVPLEIERTGLALCRSALQTGCVVSWNTVKRGASGAGRRDHRLVWLDGRYRRLDGRPCACVDPLDWQLDGAAAAIANLGALPGVHPSAALQPLVPALTGARCTDGTLAVAIPWRQRHGFADLLTMFGSYHVYDYNLFYENIRENALARATAFAARAAQ